MANANQKKDDLLTEAGEVGVDVAALPHDEGKDPTNQTIADAINEARARIDAAQAEQPIDLNLLLAYEPGLAVPIAGLLAARPELRDGKLKHGEWRDALDAYLGAPPPSDLPLDDDVDDDVKE